MKKSLKKSKGKEEKGQTYRQKSVITNYLLAFLVGSSLYFQGYYMGLMNPMGRIMTGLVFKMKTEAEANEFLGNCNFIIGTGAMITFFFVGPVANKIGRIRLLMLSGLLGIFSSLGYAIESVPAFYLMRAMNGIVIGFLGSLVPIAVTEMFPSEISGIAGCFAIFSSSAFTMVGWLTPYLFQNDDQLIAENYLWIFAGPAALGAAHLFCLCLAFRFGALDSPAFFLQKLNLSEKIEEEKIAYQVQNWLKCVYVEQDAARMTREMIANQKNLKVENSKKEEGGGFLELLSPRYRFRLFIAIMLNMTHQLSGINYLVFLSTQLFDKISGNGRQMTLVIGASSILGGVVGILTVSRLGRRFNLLSGIIAQMAGFSLLLFGIYNKVGQVAFYVASVVLYIIGFSSGIGGTLGVYNAEILPATGVGVAGGVGWLFTSFVGKLLPGLDASLGPTVLIQFFIGSMAVCFTFMYFNCVETMGLTMEQVEAYYESGGSRGKVSAKEKVE